MALTDAAIWGAKPIEGRTVKLSDGGGFSSGCSRRALDSGTLLIALRETAQTGDRPDTPEFTLKEARNRRDEAKRQLDAGLDPSQQKQLSKLASAADQANTFAALAFELLEKKRKEGKASATLGKLEWLFSLANPTLGPRPITSLTAPEVLQVLRHAESRERLETAKRLRAVIGSVFRYAIATGRASLDPTVSLRGAVRSPVVQHRAAIVDPGELGALLRAIEGYEGMPEVRLALQLLAFTFVRPGELRHAAWAKST